MTTLREAAQQALEALEDMLGWQSLAPQTIQEAAKGRAAALRAALAEPAQEPVKQCMAHGECFGGECIYQRPAEPVQEPDSPERRCGGPGCDMTCCQPVQEPVAFSVGRTLHWHEGKGVSDAQLFAAPPQRPAEPVPLTDEVIADLWHQNGGFHHHFARAIERWLKGNL